MSGPHKSIELLQAAKSGSEESVRALVSELEPYIRLTVRRRLPRLLRRRFDSTDFVQAVWTSFLTDEGLLDQFKDTDALRRYLGGAANNKVLMAIRANINTVARDMRLDVSLPDSDEDGEKHRHIDPQAVGAGPASEALANDLREAVLENAPDSVREMLRLRELGYTSEEIASRLGVSRRSVERGFEKLRGVIE